MMVSLSFDEKFATNGEYSQHNENEDMGSLARSVQYDNIDNRLTAMMMKASSSSLFGGTHMANRKETAMNQNDRLQALVTEGVLRPSDVFLKSGRNVFLARLVPGTFSYYQRVRENSFLFQEYHSCCNDSEQQRIVQEIVESVWLNEGRFLVIDKNTNSVVVVDDQQLPGMIFHDLLSRENVCPALWDNGSSTGNKIKNNNNHKNNKRKVTVAKTKNHNPLSKKSLKGSRNDNKFFTSSQKRQKAASLNSNLAENGQNQNGTIKGSVVSQRGMSATGTRPSRGGRASSRRYTYRSKKTCGDMLSY